MKESNEELARWLNAHATRIEDFEKYLESEGEKSLIGSPIHEWLLEELEECRRSAYSQPYLLQSESLDQSLLPRKLEQWKYYAAISLYTTIAKSWDKDIVDSADYPGADIIASVAANLASILSYEGFLECEPDIFGIVVEYTRTHLHESIQASSSSIIDRALLMVEAERLNNSSKRKQLQPLDPGIKKDGLTDHIQYHLGVIDSSLEFSKTLKSSIELLHLKPSASRPHHIVVTRGMSAKAMQAPEDSDNGASGQIELLISLPPFWRLDQESLRNSKWNWPLDLLLSCANYPFAMNTYLTSGHTINLGDHSYPSAYDSVLVCLSNETPADFDSLNYRGNEVDFFALLPLYPEELKLKLSAGLKELYRELDKNNVGTVIRTSRKNAATDWFERLYATTLDETSASSNGADVSFSRTDPSATGGRALPQLEAVRSWADAAVQRILERAETELPVKNLLELAYGISQSAALGQYSFENASRDEVYECALTAVLVLDANQTVYEWGKEKAVLRLSEQISPTRYELREICPRLEDLVFSTVPFIWALDHRLSLEEATDMASRAKTELNKLHGPGSLNAELHLFEQQGYGALGERNRNSRLDSILLSLSDFLVRKDFHMEDWKIGLAARIALNTQEELETNGEVPAVESLSGALSYESYSSQLRDVVTLLSSNLVSLGLGDQESSLRIWNAAIDRVNDNLKERRIKTAEQKSTKSLQRRFLELKWSIVEMQKRYFGKKRSRDFPGQNMFRISASDIQRYLTPDQLASLADKFGGYEPLEGFLDKINSRLSDYSVSMLKGEIANLGEEFDFADYLDSFRQLIDNHRLPKIDSFYWLFLIVIDILVLLVGPIRAITSGSLLSVATALTGALLYLFIMRPLMYMSHNTIPVFRLYELGDVVNNKKRGVRVTQSLSLLMIGVYLLEWTKVTDFFVLPMFIFLITPMLTAIWPSFVAANFYSLKYNGLRGFFADMKKMQAFSGKPVLF